MDTYEKLFISSEIDDVISFLPYPAHIKDSKNGKYICTNIATLEFFNLRTTKQFIGLTIKDIDIFMSPYWGTKFTNYVEKLEYMVLDRKEKIIGQMHTILLQNGQLMVQQMEKIPLIDNNGKASSILTSSHNLIDKLSLKKLYNLYKNYFKNKSKAISGLLNHIGLESYFTDLPTEDELMVLLTQRIYDNHDEVARVLNISLSAVSKYAYMLQGKIKNEDITGVLATIRDLRKF
ncbi:MAG: hypothetical protein KBD37_04585 [Burkholderiales bacterium]|nr:hypothetical protein [Burkholderiales bacterium]